MEHNDKLYDLLKKSKLELPFADFEERMMVQILKHEKAKQQMTLNKKMAVLFFLIGTIFGMVLNYGIAVLLESYNLSEDFMDKVSFFSQLIYVVLIVLFSDKLWKLFKINQNARSKKTV